MQATREQPINSSVTQELPKVEVRNDAVKLVGGHYLAFLGSNSESYADKHFSFWTDQSLMNRQKALMVGDGSAVCPCKRSKFQKHKATTD